MATLYKITLTEIGKTVVLPTQVGNKVVDQETRIRDIEVEILESCVVLVSTKEKDIKKYILCRDLYEQVKAITDTTPELTDLTKDDIDILKSGFSIATEIPGGRPFKWMKCTLIDRLIEPVEKNKEETKEKE